MSRLPCLHTCHERSDVQISSVLIRNTRVHPCPIPENELACFPGENDGRAIMGCCSRAKKIKAGLVSLPMDSSGITGLLRVVAPGGRAQSDFRR